MTAIFFLFPRPVLYLSFSLSLSFFLFLFLSISLVLASLHVLSHPAGNIVVWKQFVQQVAETIRLLLAGFTKYTKYLFYYVPVDRTSKISKYKKENER